MKKREDGVDLGIFNEIMKEKHRQIHKLGKKIGTTEKELLIQTAAAILIKLEGECNE